MVGIIFEKNVVKYVVKVNITLLWREICHFEKQLSVDV